MLKINKFSEKCTRCKLKKDSHEVEKAPHTKNDVILGHLGVGSI